MAGPIFVGLYYLETTEKHIFFKGTYLIKIHLTFYGPKVKSQLINEENLHIKDPISFADSQNLFSQRTVSNLVTERQLQSL